jgi:hypothetical protein
VKRFAVAVALTMLVPIVATWLRPEPRRRGYRYE